jgi:surface antigen
MQSKLVLAALGAVATFVIFGGNTAHAKSESTDKTNPKDSHKVDHKKPRKVVVTVKPGNTLSGIALKHHTSYIRLFNANKKIENPDLIHVGDKIRVPGKHEKLPNRLAKLSVAAQTAVVSGAVYQSSAPAARGSSAGNSYVWGTCTWYAKEMRPDLPNNLGNGGSWVANAAAQGLPTGTTPRAGAIGEEPGHVVYVEAVHGNMIDISEMNYAGGVGQVHRRTVPAGNYRYIY